MTVPSGLTVPLVGRPPAVDFGAGGGAVAGAGGGGPSIFPPHLFPPRGSTIVYKQGRAAVTAIAPSAQPAALQFRVPFGQVFVIAQAQPLILAPVDTTTALYQIMIDGVPVAGVGELSMQMRAASSLAETFTPIGIVVGEQRLVSVNLQTTDGQPYTLGFAYYGWFFSEQLAAG
jgi:hypothetical protein